MKGQSKLKKLHDELIRQIHDVVSPIFKDVFIERQDGVGNIQIFDETELIESKQSRYKIANADMLVLDNEEKPILIIEPETSSSPKTFGRSIPIYTIAKKIRVGDREHSIESPLLLLIVTPNQPKDGQKSEQMSDLEMKLKKTIDLQESSLRDFAICQINDLKPTLRRLFSNNGYDRYGDQFA